MKFTTVLIAILSLCSCIGDNADQSAHVEPAERVIIAYLCGDNDLSSEIRQKIEALRQGMCRVDDKHNKLIVYADLKSEMPKLWEIAGVGNTLIKEYSELNSASANNFAAVMKQVVADYPAESYGLICFSHASGWLPQGALNNPAGFADTSPTTRTVFDDNGREMSLEGFAEAIPTLPGGRKLEFIVFEACYMASVEVAWALRNKTNYIVASSTEMLSDGFAGIYPDGLSLLFMQEPGLQEFCRAYFDHWDAKTGMARSASVSLINTARIDELAQAVQAVAEENPRWTSAVDPAGVQHFNRNAHHLFFDLDQILEKTAPNAQLTAFRDVLACVVEYKAATPEFMVGSAHAFTMERHSGLTTYIMQQEFHVLNDYYRRTAWYGRICVGAQ